MGREPIPEALRRFILTSVRSVPFVEALLLFRAGPAPMDATMLAQRLYMSERAAVEIAREMHETGVVEREPGDPERYRYAPATPEMAAMLDMLALFYRSHLVEVTQIIHSGDARRAMQFADAFKLRND